MRESWPLTGRSAELAFIAVALRRRGRPPGVVLAGAAGVGKTRLAREAVQRVEGRNAVAHWVVGTASARALPLGAFASVLGPAGGIRGFDDVVHALGNAASGGRFVVGVDDAHLLDDVSAHVLHQLVLRGVESVIVTVRTGEKAPDAVVALWKDGYLDRLEVQALAEVECVALLEAVLGGPVDTVAAHRFWLLTRGNVLYLRQLVAAEVQTGRLREVRSVWQWDGEATLSAPLVELVEAQMGELTEEVGTVVDLLALGEPLDQSALALLTGPEAVEAAEAGGLVAVERVVGVLQARLAHPLFGEVRRGRLGDLRARRLRGLLAGALASGVDGSPEVGLRRAVLVLESGLEPDPVEFTEAARTAMTLGDLVLAERLAGEAIRAGAGFEAHLVHGYVNGFQSRDESDAELAALELAADNDEARLVVSAVRAAGLFWTFRRPAAAEALLAERLAPLDNPALAAPVVALQAAFHGFLGRSEKAVAMGREALCWPLPAQSVVMTSYALVSGLGVLGIQTPELDEAADRGYVAGRSFETTFMRYGLAEIHLVALRLAGRVDEAGRLAQESQAEMFETGLHLYSSVICGQAALLAGRLRTAIRWLREAQAGLRTTDHGHEYLSLIWLTQALALAGEASEARRALTHAQTAPHPGFLFVQPDVLLAAAWVAAAEGAITEALSLTREAATLAADRGHLAYEVFALEAAACLGDLTVAARLVELASLVEGPRPAIAAAHAIAVATDDPEGLRTASEQFADIGDLLTAADAAAQAADSFRRQGHRSSGLAAAAVAQRLAQQCEGSRTPAVLTSAHPLPLTEREREIVTLAAQGHSNQQIADRLVVSIRTVEGHLHRSHTKLGTNSRAGLAAALGYEP